jgi:molybdopterin/thiamine biosynthesis adenylyltransferase
LDLVLLDVEILEILNKYPRRHMLRMLRDGGMIRLEGILSMILIAWWRKVGR